MKIAERIRKAVNDDFTRSLDAAFATKFARDLETTFDFFGSMCHVSRAADGKKLTTEQHMWIGAYSEGYSEAMGQIK